MEIVKTKTTRHVPTIIHFLKTATYRGATTITKKNTTINRVTFMVKGATAQHQKMNIKTTVFANYQPMPITTTTSGWTL
jgi:hypothetical protein